MGFKYPYSQRRAYPSGVDEAPDVLGVYGIFSGERCLYVGMSEDSIRERLQGHAGGHSSASICIDSHSPTTYLYETGIDFPGTARERERELIQEYRPACNS